MASFVCCIVFWIIVIGVPIIISIWMGQAHVRSNFKLHVRSLHGLVVRDSSESIEVQLPSETGTVAAAFFPKAEHWYGRHVLEMHFAIPPTEAQLFVCGNNRLVRNLPSGWIAWSDNATQRHSYLMAATATPEAAKKYFEGGLLQAYFQLEKIHAQTSRVTINNDQLVLLVSEFSNTAVELSNLVVFGSQLVRQLESLQSGKIQLTTPAVVPSADAQCPICFSPVVHPVVCESCGTPHCFECWSYNANRCGVFGCGGAPAY